jgi:acyl-CoA synthetase (AMP-forming)/AMP-acid ligase II
LIELLRRADPARPAIVEHGHTTTYGELLERAHSLAAGLAERRITRFATLDHDAATAVAVMAGASLVGAESCQYPPAGDATGITEITETTEVTDLAQRLDHRLILADHRLDVAGVATITADELASSAQTARAAQTTPPAARPLLVLTTGTTGAPRGVRHDWSRVLRAAGRIKPAPDERWLLAYGLHQFAGLQILVHVMAAGATLVSPAPRRPREGLAAMRTHGVTHASATPTYWRFLLAELRTDGGAVPELRQITLGGEAVPAPLLGQLAEIFPHAHISQVYAASEFGSSGSIRDGRSGLSIDVLDRDDSADVAMKIVDGELWVRSRVGMLGYYGEDPVDADAWRPTGDVVEVVSDRILFRGRTSEIINVGGVKVHPLPIEDRIGSVPGVDMARVFGRPNAMTGAIVAVEVVAAPGADTDTIAASIRAACADLPAAARPRSVRFVDSVSMAGNKIVRRDTGER